MLSFFCPPQLADFNLPDSIKEQGIGLRLCHHSLAEVSHDDASLALWSENLSPLDVLRVIKEKRTLSVIQSTQEYFAQEVLSWIRLRKSTFNYFKNPIRVLMPEVEESLILKFSEKKDKQKLREQVEEFAKKNSNQASVDSILILFEELYMNATIDAPREAQKNMQNLSAERNGVRFYLGVDASRIVIASEDAYGSLNVDKLISRMVEVYSQGAGEAINLHAPGGAGIGCVLMFENCSVLTIGVKKNQMTVVSCSVFKNFSRRQREKMNKSIHVVYQD